MNSDRLLKLLKSTDNIVNFNFRRKCEIDNIREALRKQFIVEWKQIMLKKLKLRTYAAFKKDFCTEMYKLFQGLAALF